MGAQIAAHLANAGIPTLLLDIVPRELAADELAKGLTLETKEVRNRIARAGLESAKKAKPAAFFTADLASLVSIGNFDDDLERLNDCDLIIEAVVENLQIKQSLYEKVEQHRRPGAVIASNTSGIPLQQLAAGRSEDFRAHFLGMHFFNPPRYMHLVELIRTEWTKPEVSCSMFGFLDERLGKGVVVAKDRPNFIANRIGTFGALVTIHAMQEDSYSIEEVDKIRDPLFVYAGANDPRVPRPESDQIVAALRARKVPVEYMVADNEGHSLARKENMIAFFSRSGAFLESQLR